MKNSRQLNKYQLLCVSFISFNIFVYQFTNITYDIDMADNWYYSYYALFQRIFPHFYRFDWMIDWLPHFSSGIFFLTGILFIFRKKERRFLVVNIFLQTLGVLTQIVAFEEFSNYAFASCWWYGDMPWVKIFFYLLNVIFGCFLYRYYKKVQNDIACADFEAYYLACLICCIASFCLGDFYLSIWYDLL